MVHLRRTLLLCCLITVAALQASAATIRIRALLDSDNNASTGCSASLPAGTFSGAEQVLITTFDNEAYRVLSLSRQRCNGNDFGSVETLDSNGWDVGGSGGVSLVETHIPWSALNATAPVRLAFIVESGSLADMLVQRPGGAPIIFGSAFGPGRHHAAEPYADHAIALDGNGGDWSGIAPIAGASASGSPALRFLSVYLTESSTDLFMRFDVQANPAAPAAVDDSYSTLRGSTLTVGPPGVLGNDHDPNGAPLSAVQDAAPQHGNLVLNPDGSFTYVNDNSSATADSFRYKATNGTAESNSAQVTLTILSGSAPVITSANATTFTAGTPGSFNVSAHGNPAPSLSLTGALPNGLTFNSATGLLSGTPAPGTGGLYALHFVATNAAGTVAQAFTLTVNEAPAITSENAATFAAGTAGSFTVVTSGFPKPSLSESGALPSGVTFNPITQQLAGTPTATGVFTLAFTATNSLAVATQTFTLTVNQAPGITSAISAVATVGTAFTFTVTATGFPSPVIGESGALPNGITFAAGTLSGTAGAGSGGVYAITFTATSSAGTATQSFTLTVNEAPAITSANNATFTVGTFGTFTVIATGFPSPTIAETGALPAGVSFSGGVLSGTPGAGTGGAYPITFTAGTATQSFTLTVNQAPAITSANNATFTAGTPATFTVTTTGFPTPALSETGALPGSVTFNTATGVLNGTPNVGTGGVYTITFSATSVLSTANQSFTLTVNESPSITANPAGQIVCAGTSASFSAAATGFPAPTVQWQVSTNGGGTFSDIAGATATTYTFVAAAADNNNQYRAVFTNGSGSPTTTAATLTVNALVAPAGLSAVPSASGIAISWTPALCATSYVVLRSNTPGGPYAVLGFPVATNYVDAAISNGTTYYYVVESQSVAGVSGLSAEVSATGPGDVALCSGATASFVATASSTPSPTVQWQSSPDGITFTNVPGATSTTLSFTTTPADNGTFYRAVFSGPFGTATSAGAQLTVNTAPAVTADPLSHAACENVLTTFTAAASGQPAPAVQWQSSPDGITFSDIAGATSTTYSLIPTLADNNHQFRAVFTNGCGTATTAAATLTVDQPLSITTQPAGQSVGSNQTATFTAAASSGTATVQWQVSTDGGSTFNNVPGATSAPLSFTTSISQDNNQYRAVFTNSCGSVSSNAATLTVTCPTIITSRTGGGTFPAGTVNAAYSGESVTATGGAGPYIFAVTGGAFPAGLALASNGTISGSPTATGRFTFTVTATDTPSNCTGSQSFTISINPFLTPDSYATLVGNTEAVVTGGLTGSPSTPFVALTGSLISNDLPAGGVTAAAGTFSTLNAGTVVIASDGTFKYTPTTNTDLSRGDSFTYTISSDTGGTGSPTFASGIVTLSGSGRVWYVKNNATTNGNGQSQSPFNTLNGFSLAGRVTPDAAGDTIFVYTGDGTTFLQDSGVVLLDNEQLIGQGVALVVNGNTLVPAGTKPQIGGNPILPVAITLGNSNTVKGLIVTGSSGEGILGDTKAGFTADTITIQNNTTNGLHFNSMSGTVSVTNATVTGNGSGVVITGGGSGNDISIGGSITSASSTCVEITGRSGGTVTVSADLTSTSGNGIDVHSNTGGTYTFSGTNNFSSSTVTNVVALSTNPGATINFTGTLTASLSSAAGSNYAFNAQGGGTVNVTGANNTLSGVAALSLNGITVGSSGMTFKSISATVTGISISSVAGGTLSVTGDGSTAGSGGTISTTIGSDALAITSSPTLTTNLSFMNFTAASGDSGINGSSFGTLNVNSVTVSGSASAIALTTGTLSGSFSTVSGGGSSGGVVLTSVNSPSTVTIGGGTLNGQFFVSGGNVRISDAGNITQFSSPYGVRVQGGHTGTLTFSGTITQLAGSTLLFDNADGTYNFTGTVTLDNSATTAIAIQNGSSGTFTFGSGVSIGATSSPQLTAFSVDSSNPTVTYNGTISKDNGSAGYIVNVSNQSSGTITFNGAVSSIAVVGSGINLSNVDGTVNFNGPTTLRNGLNVISVSGGSSGTINVGSNASISNVQSPALGMVSSSAAFTYAGTINTSGGNGGITVQNNTGGSVLLSGSPISISCVITACVNIQNNTGTTTSFTGGALSVTSTNTNNAFDASGGGSVNVVGANNTLTANSGGVALNVNNTTIGASGLTFQSISASGGSNGIFLSNTGSSGGLTVTGDGTNISVGGNSTGGTIQNATGLDGSTAGDAIYLNGTSNVVLRRMTINGTNSNYAIRGFNVNGFTLEYSTVSGTNGDNATSDTYGEGAVYFGNATTNGLLGAATFTNDSISGGRARNLSIISVAASPAITANGCTFGALQSFSDATDSVAVESRTSGTTTVNFGSTSGNSATSAVQNLVSFISQSGTTMNATMNNNTFSNTHPNESATAGGVWFESGGTMSFTANNNTFRNAKGDAITFQKDSTGSLSGSFLLNTIGVSGLANSGSLSGNGIGVFGSGASGTIALTIRNNTIQDYSGSNAAGIKAILNGGSYTGNFTITGNTTREPGSQALAGLWIANGVGTTSTDLVNVCATITGNDFSTGDPTNTGDIEVDYAGASSGHVFNLPGYNSGTTTVDAFLKANNQNSSTTAVFVVGSNSSFSGSGTSCPTP